MNKKINNILKTFIFFFLLFLSPFVVKALGSATTGFSGNNSVYVGNNIEVILYVGSVSGTTNNGGLAAFGGNISYPNDKLELVSVSSLAPFTVELNGTKLGGFGQNTIKGRSNIMKFIFKAKALGSATISYSGSSQPDASASPVAISGASKTINITNPPSSNNNLSNLSVNVGKISFNKNTTSYSINVDSNVTSANITATAEDSGAKISGTGNKSLNYGSNKINIIVTAPSGAQKTYTLNIIRKDNRSGNNNLSSLKVSDGELSPKFSKNTTNYSLSVPYSVSNLTVNAKSEDSKAKVQTSGNTNLVAESTNKVIVTVTAENGAQKTYTINVKRGKDPNKKLSNNNYITHLKPSIGMLSPVFNKEKTDYEIWLPYEVDKISFDYGVEDTAYATVKFTGNETLQPGVNNAYRIIVTSESNEQRVYTINVKRAKNPSENSSTNTYLQNIRLKNGKLIGNFDKKKHDYYYTRNDGFQISDVKPEDSNSAVTVIEEDNTIYIIVTSASGENGVYTLREKQTDITKYFIYLILLVIGFVIGFITHKIINDKNKDNEEIVEVKKKKTNKKKDDN